MSANKILTTSATTADRKNGVLLSMFFFCCRKGLSAAAAAAAESHKYRFASFARVIFEREWRGIGESAAAVDNAAAQLL